MALDQIDVDQLPSNDQAEMSFIDHLEALRWHLVRSVIAILVITVVVFIAKDWIFGVVNAPRLDSFWTYKVFCNISEATCFHPPKFDLDVRTVAEKFMVHIRISVIFAIIVAFPYLFWEIWRFIKPALHENEKKAARGIVFSCSSLFISGVLFGYFLITPMALTFLGNYELGEGIRFEPNLSEYVTTIIMLSLPVGLVFQLPIAIFFLAKVGLVTPEFLKTYRRHAIVFILILAAILTPPDVVSQFLIGIPLFFLYEVSIFIAKRVVAKQKAEEKGLTKTSK